MERLIRRAAAAGLWIALISVAPALAQTSPDPEAAALIERLNLREASDPVSERTGWSPPERIVVRGNESTIAALRSAAPGVELVAASSYADAVRLVPGADAVLGFCSAEIVEAGADLQWIQLSSAGAERCVSVPGIAERDLLLTNAQRIYGPEIAEHVIAFMLVFTRGLHRYLPEQWEGRWNRNAMGSSERWELEGKTMLVVGLGGIGTEVAKRAHALGMRVVATRRSSRSGPEFVDYVGLSDEAVNLAAGADVVVNATPLTPETTGIFDAAFFDAMKPTAYFINIGRGRSVVTDDLVEALESGQIAGAGLDVTDPEPLPAGHPLWTFPDVLITPHVSAGSDLARVRLATLWRENLRRYVAGERMLSVVDVARGY
jgi:phosphoglycerate dehydrogenase-like enzyme